MTVQSYRDLIAWQKAVELVTHVYRCTSTFPKQEMYGLTSQLRRAAISIPSNIAEGQGKHSTGEFNFLGHARGSLFEIETQITIAEQLGYLDGKDAERLLQSSAEVGRILNGLYASLRD